MNPSDQRTALTKTLVPLIVAWISTTVAKHLGLELDSVGLTAGVTVGVGFVYYALVSALERWEPAFGILLGTSRGPATYQGSPPAQGIDKAPPVTTVKVVYPPGTVVTFPDAPPPVPQSWTFTIGPDGKPTVTPVTTGNAAVTGTPLPPSD